MRYKSAALFLLALTPAIWGAHALMADPDEAPATELSEKLRGFLKHEMHALAEAGRAIEAAIEAGDHAAVQQQAARMDKAFIFEREITTMDLRELELVLGEDFVLQDKEFHAMARTLEATAKAHDTVGERKVFGDMLKACVACHQAYAPEAPVLD
ncbi:MAG: hypothetical protein HWE25_10235 [Alphaproteobacteria bacterium]|nr:hypothetical protein [Alphaproteobacteria bacterium]